jgi:DNA-binding transcriptional regulator YdaS (Cro superfamily)
MEAAIVILDPILTEYAVSPKDIEVSLGVCSETVRLWRRGKRRIDHTCAQRIEARFGIPRHRMRPDIWAAPVPKTRRRERAEQMSAAT